MTSVTLVLLLFISYKADAKCEVPTLQLTSETMSEVTAVAWCPHDISHLVTCSDECAVRVWNLSFAEEKHINSSSDIDGNAEAVKNNVLGNVIFTIDLA